MQQCGQQRRSAVQASCRAELTCIVSHQRQQAEAVGDVGGCRHEPGDAAAGALQALRQLPQRLIVWRVLGVVRHDDAGALRQLGTACAVYMKFVT